MIQLNRSYHKTWSALSVEIDTLSLDEIDKCLGVDIYWEFWDRELKIPFYRIAGNIKKGNSV